VAALFDACTALNLGSCRVNDDSVAGPGAGQETGAEHVVVETRAGVRWVRLDRPEKRNAMTRAMAGRLREALADAQADDEVRVVVLTGTGPKAFCSGADKKELAGGPDSMISERRSADDTIFPVDELVLFPKPTIAAVNGPAFGGGTTMAMAADLRVCAESATLTFGLASLGLPPEWGSSYLLWRQIGWSRALDVLLTDRTLDADEALMMGLVNRVVPDEVLVDETQALAEQLASLPAGAAETTKAVLRRGLDSTYAEARKTELRALAERGAALADRRPTPPNHTEGTTS
jgi:2-(1,2-epoxy-1,2-dihydrophenyl)acetyl-CoA isomerase